jgi:hypothetical protein
MIARSIGHQAVLADHSVLFVTAAQLLWISPPRTPRALSSGASAITAGHPLLCLVQIAVVGTIIKVS